MPILLVEDDHDLAGGLKPALQNEGFAVNHVATGAAALAAVGGVVTLAGRRLVGLPAGRRGRRVCLLNQ